LNELAPLEAILETYPNHPDRKKIQAKADKMRTALNRLLNMKPNDFVPTTWQSLVSGDLDEPQSEEELEQRFREAHTGQDEVSHD
jgi:hypothetical protein